MHRLTALTTRAHTGLVLTRMDLAARWARLTANPESGMDDIPWKMILMIGGGVVAVGIVTVVYAFVKAQLAQLPTTPSY